MKDFLYHGAKTCLEAMFAAVLLILIVAIPVGTMFGIAALIDNYSHWWFLAYVPYFMIFGYVVHLVEKPTPLTP